jgi:hypothetical protein
MKTVQVVSLLIVIALAVLAGFAVRRWRTSGATTLAPMPTLAELHPTASVTPPSAVKPAPPQTPIAPTKGPVTEAKPAGAGSDADLDKFAKDLSAPGHTFFDPEYKVTGKIPEDWTMQNSARWGQKETTLFFNDPDYPQAHPSIYYRMFDQPMPLAGADIETWLREQAMEKAQLRIRSGLTDYVNRDFTMRDINDRPALTWTAEYTRNGEPWAEYMTRIYSPNGTTLFFLHAPAKDMPALVPKFESMIKTTIVP